MLIGLCLHQKNIVETVGKWNEVEGTVENMIKNVKEQRDKNDFGRNWK